MYICSAQCENLRNLEIVLRILRIPRLRSNLTIVARSRDCAAILRNLNTAHETAIVSTVMIAITVACVKRYDSMNITLQL